VKERGKESTRARERESAWERRETDERVCACVHMHVHACVFVSLCLSLCMCVSIWRA